MKKAESGFTTFNFSSFEDYSLNVKLKLCPKCKRPYLETDEFCPKCPRPQWNPESYMNVGCLLLMLLPLLGLILFWLFMFIGPFMR